MKKSPVESVQPETPSMKNQVIRDRISKNPIGFLALFLGIAAGVVGFLYILLLYNFGANPFGKYKYVFTIGFYGVFFVLGMWYFRDKLNGLKLSGPQGLFIGLGLNIVASFVFGLCLFAFMQLTGDGLQEAFAKGVENLQERNREYITGQMEEAQRLEDNTAYYNLGKELEELEETYGRYNENPVSKAGLAFDQGLGLAFAGFFHTFLFMLIFKN